MKHREKIVGMLESLALPESAVDRVTDVSIDMYWDLLHGNTNRRKYVPELNKACPGKGFQVYNALKSMLRTELKECTCSGAFASLTPDHAVMLSCQGPMGQCLGARAKRKSTVGYEYADPADFRLKEAEGGIHDLPYGIPAKSLTYLCYEDGKLDRDPSPRLLRLAKEAVTEKYGEYVSGIQVTTYVDHDDPEEFRVTVKSVKPVFRMGHNVRMWGDNPQPIRYKVYIQASLVYEDAQDARDCGWDL